MSRTNEVSRTVSPVSQQLFLNMREGKLSALSMTDSSPDGSSNFIDVKLPFHFILLDANAFRVTGGKKVGRMDRKVKSTLGHTSLNPAVNVYFVDTKEVVATGKWRDIRDAADKEGGRYMAVLFCATPAGEIITLNLKGTAYAEWLKFTKDAKGSDPAAYYSDKYFSLSSMAVHQNSMGNSSYIPKFEVHPIKKEETIKLADDCDIILQKYFAEIFSSKNVEPAPFETPVTIGSVGEEEEKETKDDYDDLPF